AYFNYDILGRRNYMCLGGQSTSCQSGGGSNVVRYGYEPESSLSSLTHTLTSGTTLTLGYVRNASRQITTINSSDKFYLPRPAADFTTAYSANTLNQYSAVGGQGSTYDANGNLLTWFPVGGKQTYTYD